MNLIIDEDTLAEIIGTEIVQHLVLEAEQYDDLDNAIESIIDRIYLESDTPEVKDVDGT